MKPRWFPAPLVSALVWGAAGSWTLFAYDRLGIRSDVWLLAVAFGVVSLGELLEVDLRGGRTTPVSGAVIFALFVVLDPPDLFVVVIPAFLVGVLVKSGSIGFGPRFRSVSRRLGSLLVARWVFILLSATVSPYFPPDQEVLVKTGAMVLAGVLELLLDTAASSMFIANAQRIPMRNLWVGQVRNRLGLHGAFLSVAALMAMAYEPLGPATFVLFLLPLLAARYAFKRYASIHTLYSQTVRALAKVPELAGYAPTGHSVAVADLATSVGREFGMSDNEVQDLEFAALLHDVGRLSMADPLDEDAPSPEQNKAVAEASAALVDKTPYLGKVAAIIRGSQGGLGPDTTVALGARILRAANIYVEEAERGGDGDFEPSAVLEQMGSAGTYDPEVLTVLGRVIRARPARVS